jgi:hypothetical protein
VSNYKNDLDEQERELARTQFENECQSGWTKILRLYPIRGHDANFAAVRDYCYPFPITVDGFRLMLENEREVKTLDLKDDTEETIQDIIHLLREHGKYTQHDLTNEEKRLLIVAKQPNGREQIKARLEDVTQKQRLARMSVGAIRQEQAANQPQPQVKILPAHITSKSIKSMPSSEIRKLIREFSAAVVNDRLFGRS